MFVLFIPYKCSEENDSTEGRGGRKQQKRNLEELRKAEGESGRGVIVGVMRRGVGGTCLFFSYCRVVP